MENHGKAGRNHRMKAFEQACFQDAGPDLRGTDQRSRRYGLHGCCALRLRAVAVGGRPWRRPPSMTQQTRSPTRSCAGRAGTCGFPLTAMETAMLEGLGRRRRFSGNPTTRWAADQARHVSRQPSSLAPHAVSGQPTVLANPAMSVMPVMAERASVRRFVPASRTRCHRGQRPFPRPGSARRTTASFANGRRRERQVRPR